MCTGARGQGTLKQKTKLLAGHRHLCFKGEGPEAQVAHTISKWRRGCDPGQWVSCVTAPRREQPRGCIRCSA